MTETERPETAGAQPTGGQNEEQETRDFINQRRTELRILAENAARSVEERRNDLKRRFNEVEGKANSVKKDIDAKTAVGGEVRDLPGSIRDGRSQKNEAVSTEAVVKEILQIFKRQPDLIPVPADSPSGMLIRRLTETIQDPDVEIERAASPYIYNILHLAINGQIDQLHDLEAEFEKLQNLCRVQSDLYDKIHRVFIDLVAKDLKWMTEERARQTFKTSAQMLERLREIEDFRSFRESDDYKRLVGRYTKREDINLLEAIFSVAKFEDYITQMATKEFGIDLNNPDPEKCIKFSKAFRERVVMLVGRLYQQVDETSPGKTWEDGIREGGIWNSIETLSSTLRTRIQYLRNRDYAAESPLRKLFLYNEQAQTEDWRTPVQSLYEIHPGGTKETGWQKRRIALPFYRPQKVDVGEYMQSIREQVEDEINLRRFLHNARALFHNPPPEGGYYKALAGYAGTYLSSQEIDILWTLPDAQDILCASQLLDKLNELDYAQYDWIHQPTTTEDKSTRLTRYEREALDYLQGINPELLTDVWKAQRAVIMGIGDNFSLSLRFLENGAWADPPNTAGRASYASYDRHSASPYLAFNFMVHTGLRFDSEMLRMGNLLFLPVVGKNLRQVGAWDHRELMRDMQKALNEFVHGRYKSDAKNGTIRFVDLINIGKVGSIYTRAGWREEPMYEGLLDRRESLPERANILNSWKALENVGIEVLKDFSGKISSYDSAFYQEAGTERRRQLATHIYKKFFKIDMTEAQFRELESGDKEENYKKFYYAAFSRAILQRIPTKFLRIGTERRRFVTEGRRRAWDEVRERSGLSEADYVLAVKDICVAEAKLRRDVSGKLREETEKKNERGEYKKLFEVTIDDYELTEESLRKHLETILDRYGKEEKDLRIERAVKVLRAIHVFANDNNGAFLKDFAKKYQEGNPTIPFAVAVEELDRSLLAHKGSGADTEKRAINDIAGSEEKVSGVIAGYFSKLREVSISGKKDFSPLIADIKKVKGQLEASIGYAAATEVVHHMAALTINFFKKDTVAKVALGVFGAGRINSLAGEFAGRSTAVWEWDSRDIDRFCTALETERLMPKYPYEMQKAPTYKPVEVNLPFFGKVTLPEKIKLFGRNVRLFGERKPDYKYFSKTLREQLGGDWRSITFDMLNKYIPIALAVILWYFISKSFEEWFGGKKK